MPGAQGTRSCYRWIPSVRAIAMRCRKVRSKRRLSRVAGRKDDASSGEEMSGGGMLAGDGRSKLEVVD